MLQSTATEVQLMTYLQARPSTRLRPKQLRVDVMTAVRTKRHSVSMSSVEAGSFLSLDATSSANTANAVRTLLSANNYHWIR